ncbi:carcinine hydrolase/isopenicillin-N N-acyltransferase family protein [Nonomuraea sp. NPDC050540]|uniref:carcinine hydrolase/isopenicillin-N N-acyltransferase family protein n=1 Tax=Nonomuraea sp. NPDC050540 TaxID=3364367 RepID=UPI0037AFC20B
MHRRTVALVCALGTVLAGGCAVQEETAVGRDRPVSSAPAAEPLLRQSADEIARTAASLRQVDDLPLYEMTYRGSYDPEAPLTNAELARKDSGWACSLFLRGGEFGRNFDWDPNPAMMIRSDPPGAYASLAMSDVSYILDHGGAPDLAADRRRLAHAVLTPFDGVNEKGLAVGLASVPTADLPEPTPERPAISSLRIIRLMLDRAATVEEALEIMRSRTVDFTGGPQVHYLIADRSGASAVAEYGGGRLHIIRDRILTNITMAGSDRDTRLADTRYRALDQALTTKADALDLLRSVAQGHTRWSVVYDLAKGSARVVTAKRWRRVHTFTLSSPTLSSPG